MANSKIEVLSPVGNKEMLTAAVRSGADAVYLGARDFNARRSADNFDSNDLYEAIKYCHIRGVRVYLTLNTVLSDEEIKRALALAAKAYSLGIDAVIVQDLGLARLLKKHLPKLPLHASTQMTAHSVSALPFLKELGFSQVVASREMSEGELKDFCAAAKELNMTVEVFVHGALCMCMSGQCYMSAMLGGRSGNRGLCAGPCRLPFAVNGGNGYDLSLKDLSLVSHIERLKELGVSSLKIEGRMKRPEYVAAATAVCRRAVDGEDYSALADTLYKVFSRSGFTDGYFADKRGADMFGIRTKDDVMLSNAVQNSLHELYRNERQSVHIKGSFKAHLGEPCTLTVCDGENEICVKGSVAEKAINKPLIPDSALQNLGKTGGTPFVFDNIKTDIEDGISLSASALNSLRREALDSLAEKRFSVLEIKKTDETEETKNRIRKAPVFVGRFSNIAQIPSDISALSAIVLPIESDFENYKTTLPLCVDIPRGIVNEAYIENRLETAKKCGVSVAFCGNIAAVTLCNKAGIKPVFDFSMNVFNSHSAKTAEEFSAAAVTLSPELTCEQIGNVKTMLPTGIIGYGRLPLMLTRNCPIKNGISCEKCQKDGTLTDRKGIKFPVRCRLGYSEIFNSRPIYLAERVNEFAVDFLTLYFTVETAEECAAVIDCYKNGAKPQTEYTRGLYYRGVE
ncbi:MAG: U32 family peptidase [Acutalibacteraceae bacterium]|nr:U32 family peptidase [Acutalibacteraceae bacterium]